MQPSQSSLISVIDTVIDALLVLAGLILACWYFDYPWEENSRFIAVCGLGSYYVFAQITRLYRAWDIQPLNNNLKYVWLVWTLAAITVFVISFLNEVFAGTQYILLAWFVITPFLLSFWRIVSRYLFRELQKHANNTRTVAIVGRNELGYKVADTLQQATWLGLNLVGFYEDRRPADGRTTVQAKNDINGTFKDLLDHARQCKVDMVYITLPLRAEDRIRQLVNDLADSTTSVYIVPNFFTFNLLHSRWTTMGELPAISIYETPYNGVGGFIKRLEDLILGSIVLCLTAIPMLLIAMGIKLTSPGPVFFKQRRGGVNGEIIKVWKFRTMTVCEDCNVVQSTRDDPRVTPFGRFLRRTSLDELPQIFNVLQGTMSLVGPRPHAMDHNVYYRPLIHRYMLRHKVKPGMTGWAQVNGWRGETEVLNKMEKRIEYDLEYIHNWSLLLDLKILSLTPITLLRNKNVY